MKRIISVLTVAALLAAMLIGAPVALAQDEEELCVLVAYIPPGNPDETSLTYVSVTNLESFLAKFVGDEVVEATPVACPADDEGDD